MEEAEGVKEQVETPSTESQPGSEEQVSVPESKPEPTTDGGVTAGGKTYTEEEVNKILHMRTKEMSDMKKEYERYKSLGKYEDLSAKIKPAPKEEQAAPALSDDDKKFVDYLKQVVPGLGKLDKFSDEHLSVIEAYRAREEKANQRYVSKMEDEVAKYCDTIGVKDEGQKKGFLDLVASVISTNEELHERFIDRDPGVIGEAIKRLQENFGAKLAKKEVSEASGIKAKVEKIQQPLPTGGIPAPISKERKLSDEERLDAAWAKLRAE